MNKLSIAFVLAGSFSLTPAIAYDLLGSKSYVDQNVTCWSRVQDFAQKNIPGAMKAIAVVPLSHVSTTQGTYGQTFISIVAVNEAHYAMVSTGEYNCDSLQLVRFYKIEAN